jgi:putative transposase
MDLISNQTFRLMHDGSVGAYPSGIYRVIFDEPISGKTVCVCIERLESTKPLRGGRKKIAETKSTRRKCPPPLIGVLIWMERDELKRLQEGQFLITVEIEREAIYFATLEPRKHEEIYKRRCRAMTNFLDFEKLKEGILTNGGVGGLVRDAMMAESVSRAYVYKQWSILCRLGISDASLMPRQDRCGALNVSRPCDLGGRKKAGRKTKPQKVAMAYGIDLPPKQPGMSSEWRAAIVAADNRIKTPIKPPMPQRFKMIMDSVFVKKYRCENGSMVAIDPQRGEYPNRQQVRRVLEVDVSRVQRLLQKTTIGHFKRSLRGLLARNWKGIPGPGHTWAIDSTVGDIYLRSSLNRAWIVGRPIVYIVVDVWSTAVVGFYVCLTGPSWNTAKISLFNSVADPELLGEMWGYQPLLSLNPAPTMCYQLMCDRGEYLSKGASLTAIKLIPSMAYAPPYRPDLKGLVEVLHRIAKDAQFLFMPGAMDHRRAEFDLRKSNPEESALTVSEYVEYLHLIFGEYNLIADRSHRVDAHMAAAGVFPSPAGLWRWGHEMGVGVRRAISQADLITTLLNPDMARVGRSSVKFGGNDYLSDVVAAEQWTTIARNSDSWQIPIHHYPGPVGRIWTPNVSGKGLLELRISDQAKTSAEVTFDEMNDSLASLQMQRAEIEHMKNVRAWEIYRRLEGLKQNAVRQTAEALERARGERPTMTEARILEVASVTDASGSEKRTTEKLRDEAISAHEEMMRAFLESANREDEDHV